MKNIYALMERINGLLSEVENSGYNFIIGVFGEHIGEKVSEFLYFVFIFLFFTFPLLLMFQCSVIPFAIQMFIFGVFIEIKEHKYNIMHKQDKCKTDFEELEELLNNPNVKCL